MGKRKILVVDDDALFADIVRMGLEDSGLYEVLTITRPDAVLGAVQALHPDLVLMDIMMPGVNGDRLAEEIISSIDKPPRIVFVSSLVTRKDQERSRTDGAAEHRLLAKPVRMTDLLACVQEELARAD